MSRRPNLFVIGAAKSGTTSLHDYLDGHPQIFMSPLKEPGYFSPDAPPPRKRYACTDNLEHYLTSLQGPAQPPRRLGTPPSYAGNHWYSTRCAIRQDNWKKQPDSRGSGQPSAGSLAQGTP